MAFRVKVDKGNGRDGEGSRYLRDEKNAKFFAAVEKLSFGVNF